MTQELIANMLGVRREGVTEAAGKLQKLGVIKYVRGKITVLDRPQLERLSCECYAVVKRETDRLLAPHLLARPSAWHRRFARQPHGEFSCRGRRRRPRPKWCRCALRSGTAPDRAPTRGRVPRSKIMSIFRSSATPGLRLLTTMTACAPSRFA